LRILHPAQSLLACQGIAVTHSVSAFGWSSDILCPGYLGQDFVISISVLAASDACENHGVGGERGEEPEGISLAR